MDEYLTYMDCGDACNGLKGTHYSDLIRFYDYHIKYLPPNNVGFDCFYESIQFLSKCWVNDGKNDINWKYLCREIKFEKLFDFYV